MPARFSGWPRAHPHSGRCRNHSPGPPRHADLRRSPSLRCPNGEGRRHRIRKALPRCHRTAGRSPQCAARGVTALGEKSPNSGCRPECSMRPPCERARQEFSSRRTVPSHEENDIPWRGVRRRPQKNQSRRVARLKGTRRSSHAGTSHVSGCTKSIAEPQRHRPGRFIAGCSGRVHAELMLGFARSTDSSTNHSALWICRENVILCRYSRVARVPHAASFPNG